MSNIGTEINNIKTTLSSWDACMSQSYCKWPVIAAIIIGSLIVLSIVWCVARCVCCGAECCCSCMSCCRGCCPTRDSRGRNSQGYQQPPPNYPPYGQYQSPMPPVYNQNMGYTSAQTATFHAPSSRPVNEDSLPHMPSWDQASTRRVELTQEEARSAHDEAMELEKLDRPSTAHQGLLENHGAAGEYYDQHDQHDPPLPQYAHEPYGADNTSQHDYAYASGAIATTPSPYQSHVSPYNLPPPTPQPQYTQPQHNNYAPPNNPRSPPPPVSPMTASPVSQFRTPYHAPLGSAYSQPTYSGSGAQQPPMSPVSSYAPSTAAPSYHTRPPSTLYPGPMQSQRRAVQGSWRDV